MGVKVPEMKNDIEFLSELCSWLQHQKGLMPQGYAKELAKIIIRLKKPQINPNKQERQSHQGS